MTLDQKIIWNQLACRDLEPAIAFYENLFGWTTRQEERKTYVHFYVGDQAVAGIMPLHGQSPAPPHWGVHVGTSDIEAYCQRAEAHGGRLLTPILDIDFTGRLCAIADPQGGVLTAFQPLDPERKSWGNQNKLGHFCWVELLCQDLSKALAFYTAVVGWEVVQTRVGDMDYHMLAPPNAEPNSAIGGVLPMPQEGVPDHFLPYVFVANADETVERAVSLGGKVHCPATDIPNYGRFAVLADLEGAAFAVFQVGC